MNRTKFANRTFFYEFYTLQFPVGRVLMISTKKEKEKKKTIKGTQIKKT
jgi:hypothetical protein